MDPKTIIRILTGLAKRLGETEITDYFEDQALRAAIDNIKPRPSNRVLAQMLAAEFPWLVSLEVSPPSPDAVVEQLGRFYAVLTEEE